MSDIDLNTFNVKEILPWAVTGAAGVLGRLTFHAKQVQDGKRKPFSWALLWDLPIALCMGWMALGLGAWLKVDWEVTISLSLATSYLGPYAIDRLFNSWTEKKFGDKDGKADLDDRV